MLDVIIGLVLSSKLLMWGTALTVVAVVLSVINGLLEIAIYIVTLFAIILVTVGVVNIVLPGVLPI